MGKLWKDVYWLYTAGILPCYSGIELYTPLYVTFVCAYPVEVTINIYESPIESPWGSRKYPGFYGQVWTWMCMCASVCEYEEVPIFVESALWFLTNCCLFGHQVICNWTWMCMCASVCEYEGVPIFVESALWFLTNCCLFGHQVICNYTVNPAMTVAIISGETNDFVKQS